MLHHHCDSNFPVVFTNFGALLDCLDQCPRQSNSNNNSFYLKFHDDSVSLGNPQESVHRYSPLNNRHRWNKLINEYIKGNEQLFNLNNKLVMFLLPKLSAHSNYHFYLNISFFNSIER